MAAALGMGVSELMEHAERLLRAGRMRRYAAVLRHREAGFTANAMGVWKVGEEGRDRGGGGDEAWVRGIPGLWEAAQKGEG